MGTDDFSFSRWIATHDFIEDQGLEDECCEQETETPKKKPLLVERLSVGELPSHYSEDGA